MVERGGGLIVEAAKVVVVGGGVGEGEGAASGCSFAFVSVLVASESLGSEELARAVEA